MQFNKFCMLFYKVENCKQSSYFIRLKSTFGWGLAATAFVVEIFWRWSIESVECEWHNQNVKVWKGECLFLENGHWVI